MGCVFHLYRKYETNEKVDLPKIQSDWGFYTKNVDTSEQIHVRQKFQSYQHQTCLMVMVFSFSPCH